MAIMGRKKRAIAQRWKALNKQFDEDNNKQEREFEKKRENQISPKEHEERLKKLKDLGLIK